jgi:ABC-type oligopeptide transport system ATPase subunit
MKVTSGGQEFYVDGTMYRNLENIKKLIKKDFDYVTLVDGYVGSGKSTLATQICKLIDPTFNIDRIAFNGKDFHRIVREVGPGKAVMFDEAMSGLHSRRAMSKLNTDLVQMMAKIRQKNLFFVMVLPSFFDLDKNIAIDRSRMLIHCYTKGVGRGYYAVYGRTKKKYLYLKGKKFYDYNTSPDIRGRFTAGYGVDEDEYRKRKHEDLVGEPDEPEIDPEEKKEIEKEIYYSMIRRFEDTKDSLSLTIKDFAALMGFTHTTYYKYRRDLESSRSGET